MRGEKWKEKVRRQKMNFFPHSPPHISCLLCVGVFFCVEALQIFSYSLKLLSHTRSNIEFNYFISSSFHLLIKFFFLFGLLEWEEKNHKRIFFACFPCIPNDICLSKKKKFQEFQKKKKLSNFFLWRFF